MSSDQGPCVKVYGPDTPPCASLPALAALFGEARQAELGAVVVVHEGAPEARKALAKRRHDLKAAMRTLGFTLKALGEGYTFQDDKAPAKIEAIAKAVQILEREGQMLAVLLGGDGTL